MTLVGSFGVHRPPAGAERVNGTPLAVGPTDGSAWAVHDHVLCRIDGTVDNAGALAASLGRDPTEPPQRLLALGFRRLGESVFPLLRGEFVIVVWDVERRVGAIARDRLGDRPLHLCRHHGGVLFASEVADLLRLLPERPAPDERWLVHWLARRAPESHATPYAGVHRLQAGHLIRLRGERWSVSPWWRPRPAPILDLDGREAAVELRREMGAAVDRTLAGSATPGVMLSGGFDSASIAALAARERRPRAYSGVFPAHQVADESDRIAVVREALDLSGVEHSVRGGGALAATFDFMERWGVPPASPNIFMWRALTRQAADDGVDVLLDGEGGDELFGCSTALLADLLMRGRLAPMLRVTRRVPGMGDHPPRRLVARALSRYAVRGALPPRVHAIARRVRNRPGTGPAWLTGEALALMGHEDPRDIWKDRRGPRWWAALVHATGPGPDAVGAADQFRRDSAMAGVRLAHPWRDTELLDFVLRLPPQLAFDPHLDRRVARDAMTGLVPDAVLTSDAKPYFNDVLAEPLAGPDRELVSELVEAPELRRYVRRDRLGALLEPRQGPGWVLIAWRIAAAGAWLRIQSDASALESLRARAAPPVVQARAV